MNRWIALMLLLLSACALPAMARQAPANDEARFIRLTRQLEQTPLEDSGDQVRAWLLQWVSSSPDITVRVCVDLGLTKAHKAPYDRLLLMQTIFGNAAFQLAHPGERSDLHATQMAGVRSALKAYASMLAKDSGARMSYLDDLLQRQKKGSLAAYMAPIIDSKCKTQ